MSRDDASYAATQELLQQIGESVRKLLKQKNVEQKDLALNTGLHRKTLSRLLKGENTSLQTLIEVLRGLGELNRLEDLLVVTESPLQQRASIKTRKAKRVDETDEKESIGPDISNEGETLKSQFLKGKLE